jgi:hypothetical protein
MPVKLTNLDIGLNTLDSYIKYLLIANLTNEQILLYESFVKGFLYFAARNKHYNLIRKLPIIYFIKALVSSEYFNANFEFFKNDNVDQKIFDTFSKIFVEEFTKLTTKQMSIFLQNVTGSQYYSDTVNVVLAYDKALKTIQNIYDDHFSSDNDQSDNNSEEIPILENNNIILDLQNVNKENNKPIYEISTCNTELTFNILPNRKNIQNILHLLTIEDLYMKN